MKNTTQKLVSHTPPPYRLEDVLGDDIACICAGSPSVNVMDMVAQVSLEPAHAGDIMRETALANAEFIVRACNSHEELLSLAQRWVALDAGDWHAVRHAASKTELLADTEKAIAKATNPEGK